MISTSLFRSRFHSAQRQRDRQPRDYAVAGDLRTEDLIDLFETILYGIRVDPHEFRGLAAVHARIQYEGLQCLQKLLGLVVPLLAERFQKVHIILLQIAALHLDIDAVADQRQFVFREHPLIREDTLHKRPGLADQTEPVTCTFDAVDAGHMENTDGLVFLECIEEFEADRLFFILLLGSQLRSSEQQRVAFVLLADLDDVEQPRID